MSLDGAISGGNYNLSVTGHSPQRVITLLTNTFLTIICVSTTHGQVFLSAKQNTEPEFVNLFRSPGIDFQPGGPVRQPYLTYRPARLHRLTGGIDSLGSVW